MIDSDSNRKQPTGVVPDAVRWAIAALETLGETLSDQNEPTLEQIRQQSIILQQAFSELSKALSKRADQMRKEA